MTTSMPIAEQQQLIRDALTKLRLGDEPAGHVPAIVHRSTIDMLAYALADHEDPATGCLAGPGNECSAVLRARQVLAGER